MINVLSPRVRVIHFPNSFLIHVTHAIVKLLLFSDTNADDYFFSFTENAYGISIVANQHVIEKDFLPALRQANCSELGVPENVFRVLQVDDEGGQELSGKRISEISEPLADGRFSILYISTYQTDFVLVNESKLSKAINTLRRHGFEVEDEEDNTSRNLDSPIDEDEEDLNSSSGSTSPTDPTHFLLDTNVLENELQCVGLNRYYHSNWIHTIIKILCYPELIHHDDMSYNERFCSFVATSEYISLIADTRIIATFEEADSIMKEEDGSTLRIIQVHFSGSNIERCGIVRHISKPLAVDAHINMLYLSTFMTANIIVSAEDLERAVDISRHPLPSNQKTL